jgi:hypothetical protein
MLKQEIKNILPLLNFESKIAAMFQSFFFNKLLSCMVYLESLHLGGPRFENIRLEFLEQVEINLQLIKR